MQMRKQNHMGKNERGYQFISNLRVYVNVSFQHLFSLISLVLAVTQVHTHMQTQTQFEL